MQAALPTYTEFDSLSPGQWDINVSDCTAIQPAPVAAGVADRAISIRLQNSSVNTPIISSGHQGGSHWLTYSAVSVLT